MLHFFSYQIFCLEYGLKTTFYENFLVALKKIFERVFFLFSIHQNAKTIKRLYIFRNYMFESKFDVQLNLGHLCGNSDTCKYMINTSNKKEEDRSSASCNGSCVLYLFKSNNNFINFVKINQSRVPKQSIYGNKTNLLYLHKTFFFFFANQQKKAREFIKFEVCFQIIQD
ncbi:hypothetical protein RFI_13823 [Reticulomyxa filosa]|uniref:Uncharacterized protein n=1 Tax=Reticulomyxa filosa TaxID=46433 RepID=X6NBI4_RETFI|nr:hypothetical protein RFI_13823 [Reticulomyxa filosa]|eukprot:ETO23356.1 hypothetical protein RFI_13823 [Reticulomyxa filosa]